MQTLITTTVFGLKKGDVDAYIAKLTHSFKDKLSELIKEKKLLERAKQKLLVELNSIEPGAVVYEDVEEPVSAENTGKAVDAEDAQKTIVLINELAEQKIEQMIDKAKTQVAEYDVVLENLNEEMEENKRQIEQLLSDVITLLQTNISEVFDGQPQKSSGVAGNPDREKVIDLFDKKSQSESKAVSAVPKDIEDKMMNTLRSYNDIKSSLLMRIDNIIADNPYAKGAVLLVEISNLLLASYFSKSHAEDELIDLVVKGISELSYKLQPVRLSYDQIAILLEDVNEAASVSLLADGILRQIEGIGSKSKASADISANIGIALYPQNATDSETIMNCAAIALFKSKENGKGNYEFINDDLIREIKLSGEFKQDLYDAVEKDELALFYQPQFSAEGNTLFGFEALLRWQNEKYFKVPILQVIQAAEKDDLISKIGTMVFRKACIFAKKINTDRQRDLIVSVNFSNVQISKSDFVETVQSVLLETGVDPKHIGFEITESCFMECFGDNCSKIQRIKDLGVTILIDDFGTGYSTLSYLINLPVSIVKIDKTFLDSMATNERNANFVSSIIDISHDLGLKVIAEGIETERQREMLSAMGCDVLQGYLLSKPAPEDDACKFL